jgi:hypothetical protein
VTTENASYPAYRLYDRDIGLLFKATAFASPFAIHVDQGAVISYPVNRLIIPAGHNLNGLACSLRYSTDNFAGDDHEAVGWTQGDALIINKPFTAQTKQYWKLNVTAPATIVEMPEFYLTYDYTFEENPAYGLTESVKRNVIREESLSGLVQRTKFGDDRRARRYQLNYFGATQKANLEAWNSHYEGTKFFYILDHAGALIYMELTNDLEFVPAAIDIWSCALELFEVIV